MSDVTPQESNAAFLDLIQGDSGSQKRAAEAVNEFTRLKMREEGFYRRILPMVQISDDDLDRQVDTDKPVKVIDKEPGVPAAITVPFATNPQGRYIRSPRYRVMFGRIMSPKFTKDVDELRTYHMDIRQVISDNAIKDMLAEEDGKWIGTVNAALVSQGGTVPETGTVQWTTSAGPINRDTLADSLKAMPSTPNSLQPAVALINNISVIDVLKFGRDEAGGDMSQDMLLNGFTEVKIFGVRWIVTIKKDLVPTDSIYYFAEPKYLGKSFVLTDTTMHLDREAFMIEFFAYETIGGALGNVAGVSRHDFNV